MLKKCFKQCAQAMAAWRAAGAPPCLRLVLHRLAGITWAHGIPFSAPVTCMVPWKPVRCTPELDARAASLATRSNLHAPPFSPSPI